MVPNHPKFALVSSMEVDMFLELYRVISNLAKLVAALRSKKWGWIVIRCIIGIKASKIILLVEIIDVKERKTVPKTASYCQMPLLAIQSASAPLM